MKRSSDRILTTHVGSLIRPPALLDFLRAKQAGEPYDEAAYDRCLDDTVADVVRQQAEIGIDVVSDGEFGKSISWSQYVLERLSGFERRPIIAGRRSVTPRRRSRALRGILRRARRPRRRAPPRSMRSASGRSPIPARRSCNATSTISKPRSRASSGRGVPAGGGAGQRHPRPQERILQERRGADPRHRRGDAHRIPHDHRRRLRAAARRCARRRHL